MASPISSTMMSSNSPLTCSTSTGPTSVVVLRRGSTGRPTTPTTPRPGPSRREDRSVVCAKVPPESGSRREPSGGRSVADADRRQRRGGGWQGGCRQDHGNGCDRARRSGLGLARPRRRARRQAGARHARAGNRGPLDLGQRRARRVPPRARIHAGRQAAGVERGDRRHQHRRARHRRHRRARQDQAARAVGPVGPDRGRRAGRRARDHVPHVGARGCSTRSAAGPSTPRRRT